MNGNGKTSKTHKHNKQAWSLRKINRTVGQDFHLTKSLMIYVYIHYLNSMI